MIFGEGGVGRQPAYPGFFAANIYTDEHVGSTGVGDADTKHGTVHHKIEERVRGHVHTNTVEGVWSLPRQSIVGSYHHVTVKHPDSYLDELEWRFNNRNSETFFRDTLVKLLKSDNLTYQALTG